MSIFSTRPAGTSAMPLAISGMPAAAPVGLAEDPERGDLMKGGGGIRKLRHAMQGRGKSGGVRVIYYWLKEDHQIYMLVVYPEAKKDDLTDKELGILRNLVKEL